MNEATQRLEQTVAAADKFARAGEHSAAWQDYAVACEMLRENGGLAQDWGEERTFWLRMSLRDAAHQLGRYADVLELSAALRREYMHLRIVVGNPLFHLRLGQAKYELTDDAGRQDEQAGAPADELSRALICGGIELFDGEPVEHLELVVARLDPPEGCETWEASRGDYPGCMRNLLNGSEGYLREMLSQRIGPPPWGAILGA